ncbi:Beta-galactosidase [Botrimarina colliarenosi]|uniref:Beta-galactosidase n=1 Tax=Botrimarina colliarenosi TaxID=2528001 RepID=A0A5C6AC95_9BACT|nr:glycoside hydrolase family 2 TIM barrel-domain containing protein [Botrimarina colliarenosi]TWT97672.1 Beta-galactosidase [Botrimarina colliarenosi]
MRGTLFAISMTLAAVAVADDRRLIDADWRFHHGDAPGAEAVDFDDTSWREVDLPHDAGIAKEPAADAPSGGAGGYHDSGVVWYRRTLRLEASKTRPHPPGAVLRLEFDGAYQDTQVWLNGEPLGKHVYGYTPFDFDITDRFRFNKPNVVAVRVDNSAQPNCRWYSGTGLYRHVWLRVGSQVAVAPGSLWTHTERLDADAATLKVAFDVQNVAGEPVDVVARVALHDPDGGVVAETEQPLVASADGPNNVAVTLDAASPRPWSIETPTLYDLRVELFSVNPYGERRLIDEQSQRCGLRTLETDLSRGLLLNGEPVKLFGGNVHHDHGPLGAASFDDAERRRVRLLKAAGFNAIRTSHNPPAEAFLDACDELGMLVLDEAFDGWRKHKTPHDYGSHFDADWRDDLAAFVRRDRRHPSVFAWSIGNEMFERGDPETPSLAKEMAALVRSLNPTRPVMLGVNGLGERPYSDLDPLFEAVDIAGYNYEPPTMAADHARKPSRLMIATESYPAAAVESWRVVTKHPRVLGDFVWSAIDYLGEGGLGRPFLPGETPKKPWEADQFPYRGAVCGDLDLLGHRKPVSHHRNIVWERGETLSMAVVDPAAPAWGLTPWSMEPAASHWNWNVEPGAPVRVQITSRWPRVRCELNGRLIGEAATGPANDFAAELQVPYEPGDLVTIGLDAEGVEQETVRLRTAGPADRLTMVADRKTTDADKQRLVFLDIEIVDEEGKLQPSDDRVVHIAVDGPAVLQGVGSADLTSGEAYSGDSFTTSAGRVQAVVRSQGKPGDVQVTASADGLESAVVKLTFGRPSPAAPR